jgi:hypothetical protein
MLLDVFLDIARDKSDEFPEFHEWDSPCFDVVIQGPRGNIENLGRCFLIQQITATWCLIAHASCVSVNQATLHFPFL